VLAWRDLRTRLDFTGYPQILRIRLLQAANLSRIASALRPSNRALVRLPDWSAHTGRRHRAGGQQHHVLDDGILGVSGRD